MKLNELYFHVVLFVFTFFSKLNFSDFFKFDFCILGRERVE